MVKQEHNKLKSILITFSLLLSGCAGNYYSFPINMVSEQIEFSNLEGEKKCDKTHIDFRKECRAKLSKEDKETKQMSESMKKKHW